MARGLRTAGISVFAFALLAALALLTGVGSSAPNPDVTIDMTETACQNAAPILYHDVLWDSRSMVPEAWLGQSIPGRFETKDNTAIFTAEDGTKIEYTTEGSTFSNMTCLVWN